MSRTYFEYVHKSIAHRPVGMTRFYTSNICSAGILSDMKKCERVVIFSLSYCEVCTALKEFMDQFDEPYRSFELNELEDGDRIAETLRIIYSTDRVPWVFFNGTYVGHEDSMYGCFRRGKLRRRLDRVP